jgi:hypothetical protein
MVPEGYWRLWADPIIHTIHMRVLKHVASISEAAPQGADHRPISSFRFLDRD